MKVPSPPPALSTFVESLPTLLPESWLALGSPTATDPYLPWDKFKFRKPPTGLTVHQWWLLTRLTRSSSARPIAQLRTMDGSPLSFNLPDELLRGIDDIARNASGEIVISEQVTNPATRNRYIVSSLIEEAITSSQLEGASTTRRVAKEMIRSGRSPQDRSEQMIFNNFQAMQRITEIADADMTPELVCEIHRIVTERTLDNPDAAGELQHDDADRVSVWGDGNQLLHRPPPVHELPDRIAALCDFSNGRNDSVYIPPVLRAMAIHFMMGYDHYFEDGNGRTARALFYWSMLHQGYWLAEFLTISKILKSAPAQYARSFLHTEQDSGDLTHFFLYHVNIIQRSISELHEYLSRKAQELRDLQEKMKTQGEFNHRQVALVEYAMKHPSAVFSVQSHVLSHNVTQQTARSDLMQLAERGLLHVTKVGRRFTWMPVSDLAKRIVDYHEVDHQ